MHITRNNYMLFFLDYYEGTLPEREQEELMRFLDVHADLKVEFYDFEMVQLPEDTSLRYPDKISLKKADEENYEELFAAYAEGDLDAATEKSVEALAASDAFYARELELMQNVRVMPDHSIQYEGKAALKHHYIGVMRRKIIYYSSAAAAVLLVAALVYTFLMESDKQRYADKMPVAGDTDVPVAVEAPPVPRQDIQVIAAKPENISGELPSAYGQVEVDPVHSDRLIADIQPGEKRKQFTQSSYTEGPISLDLTAFRRPSLAQQPLETMAMVPQSVQQMPQRAEALPATIKARNEFMWLAYLDPAEFPNQEEEDTPGEIPAGSRREIGLAELAFNRLSENTNLNLDAIEKVISNDGRALANLAGEGMARVAPVTERVLGVETTRNDEGRLVGFAIGDLFSVSRR
jgi:hypothetical protein